MEYPIWNNSLKSNLLFQSRQFWENMPIREREHIKQIYDISKAVQHILSSSLSIWMYSTLELNHTNLSHHYSTITFLALRLYFIVLAWYLWILLFVYSPLCLVCLCAWFLSIYPLGVRYFCNINCSFYVSPAQIVHAILSGFVMCSCK